MLVYIFTSIYLARSKLWQRSLNGPGAGCCVFFLGGWGDLGNHARKTKKELKGCFFIWLRFCCPLVFQPMLHACFSATMSKVINSYTENAGVAGQNNKQVAAYADLGEAPERLSFDTLTLQHMWYRDRNMQGVERAFW